MEAPEQGTEPSGGNVPVFQVDQLVEDHVFIGLPAHRHHQHRGKHAHQEGPAGLLGFYNFSWGPQFVFLRPVKNRFSPLSLHGDRLPQGPAQFSPAQQQPDPAGQRPQQIQPKQTAGQPFMGLQPQLHGNPQAVDPGSGVQDIRPPPGRHHQTDQKHEPDGIPPFGRQFVPKNPLDHQQKKRRHTDLRAVQKHCPKIHAHTSISSRRRRSSSRSSGLRLPSFTNAATRRPALPW